MKPNPRRMLDRLPRFMRGWVSLQNGDRPRDVPTWSLRVQRYRVMAQWHYRFADGKAEEALAEATAKGYEVAGVLEKHHFPLAARAGLVTRDYPRKVFTDLPRGIMPYIHRGELRGYRVCWMIGYTKRSRYFTFSNGDDLAAALALRAGIEQQARIRDEERMELFCEVMSGLGAYLSEVAPSTR